MLKLQEELKSTRNSLRAAQTSLDLQKRKVDQKEQETFSAQYQFIALQEELEKVKAHVQTIEEERDALKNNLKEEEVARIAAEGRIALPTTEQDDDDLLSPSKRRSPQKRPVSPLSDDKENSGVVTKKLIETRKLIEEVARERQRRRHAEEMAEFLRSECRFLCCTNHSATSTIEDVVATMSEDVAVAFQKIRQTMLSVLTLPSAVQDMATSDEEMVNVDASVDQTSDTVVLSHRSAAMDVDEPEVDRSVTFGAQSPILASDRSLTLPSSATEEVSATSHVDSSILSHGGLPVRELHMETVSSRPQTPEQKRAPMQARQPASIRTVTTTITVPMHFTPSKTSWLQSQSSEVVDEVDDGPASTDVPTDATIAPAFDREAALAAIAYRRGRAKSIANGHATPRKQMIEGVSMKERRDISAPALGQKPSTVQVAKGAASASKATGGRTV